MIVERESIMTEEDLNNETFFPNYLVLRQPSDQDEMGNSRDEW